MSAVCYGDIRNISGDEGEHFIKDLLLCTDLSDDCITLMSDVYIVA